MAGYYRKGVSVVCPDGKVRKVQARHYWDGRNHCLAADTAFTVPAGIRYRGKYYAGYVGSRENDAFEWEMFFQPFDYNSWPIASE